ncbi:lysoplasmalogenase family protein [Janibacter limosus]|uniref:lysoplasmalogenase family protein n=1 Tax=Janibacter limosus TaxID=53458 RepID=UPI0008361967|nr:lysoplasmalogenase family protein [Janibacter limosus]
MPALAALAVVTLIHLGAQATAPGGVLADVTQVLLMPLLGWFLVTTTPRPHSLLVRLTVVALVLSWLGDTVPRFVEDGSELGFMLMLGAFLLAQLAYVAALYPFVESSIARTRPVLIAPYAIALAALLVVVTLGSGFMWQVALYGIAIMTMAVLATGLDRVATLGAIVFVISDALIAVRAFADLELPLHGVWVMLTYVIGQTLLVAAIAHRDRVDRLRRP